MVLFPCLDLMLYDTRNRPIPPTAVTEALKKIDPTLMIAWLPPSEVMPKGVWSVMARWPKNDKRYALIRRGDMAIGTDYDSLAFLPEDCPVEQAAAYVKKSFARWSGKTSDARKLVDRLSEENEKAAKENMRPVEEFAEELVKTNAKTMFREQGKTIPKIFMSGG